jgi:hypothetical protein
VGHNPNKQERKDKKKRQQTLWLFNSDQDIQTYFVLFVFGGVGAMVFNTTFINISVIHDGQFYW